MKTSFKFNQVINDAGQLAPTEGHTDQSSSPRVSSCGLLSFSKGDIVKTQKYYTLLQFDRHITKWVIVFGDYDRETVEDERDDCEASYGSSVEAEFYSTPIYKIISSSDAQADIEAKVAGLKKPLNEKNSSWEKVQLSTKSASEIKKIIYDLTDHSNPLTSNTAR